MWVPVLAVIPHDVLPRRADRGEARLGIAGERLLHAEMAAEAVIARVLLHRRGEQRHGAGEIVAHRGLVRRRELLHRLVAEGCGIGMGVDPRHGGERLGPGDHGGAVGAMRAGVEIHRHSDFRDAERARVLDGAELHRVVGGVEQSEPVLEGGQEGAQIAIGGVVFPRLVPEPAAVLLAPEHELGADRVDRVRPQQVAEQDGAVAGGAEPHDAEARRAEPGDDGFEPARRLVDAARESGDAALIIFVIVVFDVELRVLVGLRDGGRELARGREMRADDVEGAGRAGDIAPVGRRRLLRRGGRQSLQIDGEQPFRTGEAARADLVPPVVAEMPGERRHGCGERREVREEPAILERREGAALDHDLLLRFRLCRRRVRRRGVRIGRGGLRRGGFLLGGFLLGGFRGRLLQGGLRRGGLRRRSRPGAASRHAPRARPPAGRRRAAPAAAPRSPRRARRRGSRPR